MQLHPTIMTFSGVRFNQIAPLFSDVVTLLSSFVVRVLTLNGRVWVVPLLHSVNDICAGLYVIHLSCSEITVDGVRTPHLFPMCTTDVVRSQKQD
jgi:hypothetical protein